MTKLAPPTQNVDTLHRRHQIALHQHGWTPYTVADTSAWSRQLHRDFKLTDAATSGILVQCRSDLLFFSAREGYFYTPIRSGEFVVFVSSTSEGALRVLLDQVEAEGPLRLVVGEDRDPAYERQLMRQFGLR